MLIILTLYVVLVWLLFSKLKLVRWGWFTGSVVVFVGAFILAGTSNNDDFFVGLIAGAAGR